MKNNHGVARAVRFALSTASGLMAGLAAPYVLAQQAPPPTAVVEEQTLKEVLVTGTRIAEPSIEAISPITTVDAVQLSTAGVVRVEDFLNTLPQVMYSQAQGQSQSSSGTANVNLRGLGTQRTLILIDGRRLMPGDPTVNGVGAADLNNIPIALVDRVDVLTGGASSTYGADAVAGVVNFVMNDHFEGFRIDGGAAINNHVDHESQFTSLVAEAGFPAVPSGTHWDGENKDVTAIWGSNLADGKGNVTAYIGYRQTASLSGFSRDFAHCGITNAGPGLGYICSGSGTSYPTNIFGAGTNAGAVQVSPTGTLVPSYASYNYHPWKEMQREDQRYTAGIFSHYKITDKAEAYSEFSFMNDNTPGGYAPAGAYAGVGPAVDPLTGHGDGNWTINCGTGGYGNPGMNPFLSRSEYAGLCNYAPYTSANIPANAIPYSVSANGLAQLTLGRRSVETGGRYDDYQHTSYRGLVGVRGEFASDWKYDVYGQYGTTNYRDNQQGMISYSKAQNALSVVTNPVTGQPECLANANGAGGAPGCVPWNIWQPGGVTPAALAYISVPGIMTGSTTEEVVSGYISGDLTRVGIKTPWAAKGLSVVIGAEYRQEGLVLSPDEELESGDDGGSAINGPVQPVNAAFHVYEGFTEARVPILQDVVGAESLNFETGYRYSSYSEGFNTNTYKFGLEWAPVGDVRMRVSWDRAVRAPNIQELYQAIYVGTDGSDDICAGSTPQYSLAQCERTGVTPAQYGHIFPNPATNYNGQQGGNPSLKPEASTTKSVGLVVTPAGLAGFEATIDYFDIRVSNLIGTYGFNYILDECALTGASTWCGLVHREPSTGSLWLSPAAYITDTSQNLGSEEVKGVDLGASYRVDFGRYGSISLKVTGSYESSFIVTPVPGAPSYNCAGYYGATCGYGRPDWRHRFTADWISPITGLTTGFTWRYFGGLKLDATNPDNPSYNTEAIMQSDARVPSVSYLDLHASYALSNKTVIRVGVNNVFDKDPPDMPDSQVENNAQYDILGRFIFVRVTHDF